MKLVKLVFKDKKNFYEGIVRDGGEGVMLKSKDGQYIQQGRPDCMQKAKRFEEVDAFVSGFEPGDQESGWFGLVGSLIFSCYLENSGNTHEVAKCSNLDLQQRIDASVCGNCGGKLDVKHDNVNGKRVILGTSCSQCKANRPSPALAQHWYKRVFEVKGQEWTARVFRLKHAVMERERVGVDGKSPKECTINLRDIQERFVRAQSAELD